MVVPDAPIEPVACPNSDGGSSLSPFLGTLGSILLQHAELEPGLPSAETAGSAGDAGGDGPDAIPATSIPVSTRTGSVDRTTSLPLPFHVSGQLALSGAEVVIFRNYVDKVSCWVDSFSYDQPFHRVVPVLALRCPLLLNSCLALSSKQMVLAGTWSGVMDESAAFRYYRRALQAVGASLVHARFAQSDEVLAACIILST